jgi:hypothetical protein
VPTADWERGYAAGYHAAHRTDVRDLTTERGEPKPKAKKRRKASKYNLEYKKQYAKLKKAHPRTSFAALAKKAHKATKRVMK